MHKCKSSLTRIPEYRKLKNKDNAASLPLRLDVTAAVHIHVSLLDTAPCRSDKNLLSIGETYCLLLLFISLYQQQNVCNHAALYADC